MHPAKVLSALTIAVVISVVVVGLSFTPPLTHEQWEHITQICDVFAFVAIALAIIGIER